MTTNENQKLLSLDKMRYEQNLVADAIVRHQAKLGDDIDRKQGLIYANRLQTLAVDKLQKRHRFARVSKRVEGILLVKDQYVEEYTNILKEILSSTGMQFQA